MSVTLALLSLGSGTPSQASSLRSPNHVLALLADRSLIMVDPTGRIEKRVHLGTTAPPAAAVGDLLALAPNGDVLALTPPGVAMRGQEVVRYTADLKRRRTIRLPSRYAFRGIAVGQRTGRLFIAGNRPGGPGSSEGVLIEMRSARGTLLKRWTLRHATRDWRILSLALSPSERLAVSYHGSDTTGADVLTSIEGRRCVDPTPNDGLACLRLHGAVAFRGENVVATTGEGPLVELTPTGATAHLWQPNLPRNHLMEFALQGQPDTAAVIGSCGYSGGLSVITLGTDETRVVGYPSRLCGERIRFVSRSVAVIGRNPLPVPQGSPAAIDFVNVSDGQVLRRIETASEIVDLLPL